jgi:esterase/lipase
MTKKKIQVPLFLKFVRWAYPKAEALVPGLAYRFFVQLFFTPLRYKAPEHELHARAVSEKFSIKVAGKKIQCYKWGNSPKTVFLLHGWAGRATQFRKFFKPLISAGYQVVGFDGPAHGESEGRQTNLDEFEQALKQMCERFGEPEAIIAHSFGGTVALFAASNGLRVKTLVNIASPVIGDEIIDGFLKAIGGTAKTKDYFKKEVIRRSGKPFDEFTALHFVKNLKQHVNLLLVHDQDDKEVSMNHPYALMEVYPKAELYHTRNLGHTRILRDDQVIRKILSFIQRNEAEKAI